MRTLCFALVLAASTHAFAADSNQHLKTTAPDGARYELIESATYTFKLDRFTGEVWQMVWIADERKSWVSLPVPGLAAGKKVKPRFQMFSSGGAARQFLLDTDTGASWVLEQRKDAAGQATNAWVAFAEPPKP